MSMEESTESLFARYRLVYKGLEGIPLKAFAYTTAYLTNLWIDCAAEGIAQVDLDEWVYTFFSYSCTTNLKDDPPAYPLWRTAHPEGIAAVREVQEEMRKESEHPTPEMLTFTLNWNAEATGTARFSTLADDTTFPFTNNADCPREFRKPLHLFCLGSEGELWSKLLGTRFFAAVWREFRDDFLWTPGHKCGRVPDMASIVEECLDVVAKSLLEDESTETEIDRAAKKYSMDEKGHVVSLIQRMVSLDAVGENQLILQTEVDYGMDRVIEAMAAIIQVLRYQYLTSIRAAQKRFGQPSMELDRRSESGKKVAIWDVHSDGGHDFAVVGERLHVHSPSDFINFAKQNRKFYLQTLSTAELRDVGSSYLIIGHNRLRRRDLIDEIVAKELEVARANH
ncbi:hypothetical protein IWZ00DRAFT_542718 [Phyllosticta capitalensis]